MVEWYSSSWETSLRATERHLPYRITPCVYLPADTGKRAPPYPQTDRPALDLPTPEVWKAELTLVSVIPRWFTCPKIVTRLSSNRLIAIRPEVEPTTSRSQVQRPNCHTTKPPSHYHGHYDCHVIIIVIIYLPNLNYVVFGRVTYKHGYQ